MKHLKQIARQGNEIKRFGDFPVTDAVAFRLAGEVSTCWIHARSKPSDFGDINAIVDRLNHFVEAVFAWLYEDVVETDSNSSASPIAIAGACLSFFLRCFAVVEEISDNSAFHHDFVLSGNAFVIEITEIEVSSQGFFFDCDFGRSNLLAHFPFQHGRMLLNGFAGEGIHEIGDKIADDIAVENCWVFPGFARLATKLSQGFRHDSFGKLLGIEMAVVIIEERIVEGLRFFAFFCDGARAIEEVVALLLELQSKRVVELGFGFGFTIRNRVRVGDAGVTCINGFLDFMEGLDFLFEGNRGQDFVINVSLRGIFPIL